MTSPSETAPIVSAPAPPPAAVWEDFLDIFYAPSRVFARRINGKFLVPLLFLMGVMGALYFANQSLLAPIMDAEWNRQAAIVLEKNPQLTAEQVGQMRSMTERFGPLIALVMVPIMVCLLALVIWVVGKFFESTQTIRSAFVVATYGMFPRIIEQILAGVQALFLDPASLDGRFRVSLGIGRFMDPDTASPLLLALLGRVDVFTIWVTVLVGIGLMITGKVPAGRAAIAAVIVWLFGAVPAVVGALRQ